MPGRSTKRQKEQARKQHPQEKDAKKEERKKLKAERGPRQPGDANPDIENIIPGPQLPLEF
ncbi:hypothetical protein MVI01_26020 [Myxococcus virescens]|uniref:Uncharacterized protein n=1 Tax=Myxococcus virescens TaxID=83456 RepID=A0A511HB91_9BACT|nr:hypothetical protein [Myxococcus virescens]GEL70818.1 hypothetical protein MVI01_26020 [Myxococcus virescens]SDE22675.1 hypothetical protein SAMN04488504_105123 [Myxococcus virescens]